MPRMFCTAACAVAVAADVTINATVNTNTGFGIPLSYLAFNIDTGSLYNQMDLRDPVLTNLLRQMVVSGVPRSVILRIGGGAADSTLYTGAEGPSGGNPSYPWNNTVLVNNSYIDDLMALANATTAGIVWNLNGVLRDSNNAWDPSLNATAMFAYLSSKGYGQFISGWQLGNEPTLWSRRGVKVSGTQLGQDYVKLRSVLAQYPDLPQTVYGPEGCCGDDSFLAEFLPVVYNGSALDYLSEHYYPIQPKTTACTVPDYLNKSYYDGTLTIMNGYKALLQQYAPTIPLVLGETATTNMGGCPTLSASFVAGFYYLYILGAAAINGISQVNRQDLVGWSSQTEASQYMLTGPPGWINAQASGALTPHPDWFTSVLFRENTIGAAMNVTWSQVAGQAQAAGTRQADVSGQQQPSSQADYSSNFGLHAFCGIPMDSSQKGAVTLTYVNTGAETVTLQVTDSSMASSSRVEFILTSQASASKDSQDPPASLTGDSIYLNGELLSVNSNGLLPAHPIPGRAAQPSTPIQLPPYSYGLIYLGDANAYGACGDRRRA